jgi:protein tyrosine/serine phosphatase
MTAQSRDLAWGDCLNVRDLGGHETATGGVTRRGVVVRSDALDRLTPLGWEALFEHGVTTVVDLRTTDERIGRCLPGRLEEVHVPLFEDADAEELFAADGLEDLYCRMLERRAGAFADAVGAIAEAGSGGIVVHCQIGKDRTGLVCAFVLALAGVPDDAIGSDYALSESRVQPLVAEWIEAAFEPGERARRAWLSGAGRDTMLATLSLVERRFGGVEGYLRAAGSTSGQLAALRRRLVTPARASVVR